MNTLTNNIINLYAEKGRIWLNSLPDIINNLCIHWNLSKLTPVDNMTFNYVTKAIHNNSLPVVLKIGHDEKTIYDEVQALKHFNGDGSIQIIDYNKKYNALLLQQAIPGTTLKSLYPAHADYVIDHYLVTMQQLHMKSPPAQHSFRHIRDWLKSIDNLTPEQLPEPLLTKAMQLKTRLLTSLSHHTVLHGDLHHDNILKHGEKWIAIDPKGIIGEPEFEVAAFDFMHSTELEHDRNIISLFEIRVNRIAQLSGLNPQRIINWVFVRLLLAVAWSIEDNCDTSWHINLANIVIKRTD